MSLLCLYPLFIVFKPSFPQAYGRPLRPFTSTSNHPISCFQITIRPSGLIARLLNPNACEGHNNFVVKYYHLVPKDIFWSLTLLPTLLFPIRAYQLPHSNAKPRPEDSRIYLSFFIFWGSIIFERGNFELLLVYLEYQNIYFQKYDCWNFQISPRGW